MFPWIAFLTYALINAITPGPNTMSSLSNGTRLGFRKSLPFSFGIWTGFSIVMVLCTVLCSLLNTLIPRIKTPMLILGALYILRLAWRTWHSGPLTDTGTGRSGFASGFLLQFVNPKIYIYGIVSMEAYVLPVYHGNLLPLLFFALLLAFIGFVCNLLWSGFGSTLRRLFSHHTKTINTAMALLLVWCAISLFL